jgi:N6-adenosine-specific RNA methylase IME4
MRIAESHPPVIHIDLIKIGARHRRDLGDIDVLARSIADIGLLHPVVIDRNHRLIAGRRRLEAAKRLGWTEVPITVVDLDQIVRGEFAENIARKDFLPSEIDAIRRTLQPIEDAAARKRQGTRTDLRESFPESSAGRARDKVGAFAGVSGRQIEKIATVVAAAEAEPERFGKLLADMDRTGRVNGPYRRLLNARQAERILTEPPPLPGRGPYRVSVVDIPWAYEPDDDDAPYRGVLPYPTMSVEQACALDVAAILHDDAVLWFWIPNFHFVNGLHLPVLRAWRLVPKTMVTWPKDKPGQGHWLRGQTEHAIMAVRGKPVVTLTNETTLLRPPFNVVCRNVHSAKPAQFYDFVEKLCPAPRYADLFSRYQHNERWDTHGAEAPADQDDGAQDAGAYPEPPEHLKRAEPVS